MYIVSPKREEKPGLEPSMLLYTPLTLPLSKCRQVIDFYKAASDPNGYRR